MSLKRTRIHISDADKKKVCEYAQEHPAAKRQEIIDACFKENENTGKLPDVSTISKILKDRQVYLALEISSSSEDRFRHRQVKYPLIEEATLKWLRNATTAGLPISDAILQEKACNIRDQLQISAENFDASSGWLEKFKNRHNIKLYITHGEAGSAPIESLPHERQSLQTILTSYALKDIYNADETGLFYRMLPNQTLASASVAGKKGQNSRFNPSLHKC